MRIGLVTHVYPAPRGMGGIPGIFIPPFARALADRGHEVWVVAPGRPSGLCEENGIRVSRFAPPDLKGGLAALRLQRPGDWLQLASLMVQGSNALRRMLAQHGADVLLGYWAFPAGLWCRWASVRHGVPYGIWALGSDIYQAARLVGLRQAVILALRGASARYANGPALCRIVEQLARSPCEFMPAARPLPPPERPCLPNRHVHLLFAGRLEPVKGPDVLLQAAAELMAEGLDFHLWMVGEGSMQQSLREAIAANGLAAHVSMLCYVSDASLSGYLSSADMVVVPSRSESMPLVVTEAARLGTPLVVTDVGDMGPLVRTYGAGVVVPPERPGRLAAAVQQVANTDESRSFSTGLQALADLYSFEAGVDRFLADAVGWRRRAAKRRA